MSLQRRVVPTFVFSLLCVCATGCSLFSDSEPESGSGSNSDAWYNKPGFRSIWGDFDKSESLAISDPVQLEALRSRGEYLAKGVAACGACHGAFAGDPAAPLSGGRLMRDRFGEVRAANLTPDRETGLGAWNFVEIMRAIRASIDREGRPLSLDLHGDYRWLSDRDAKAIAIYLQSLQPVKNPIERRVLGGFERNRWLFFSRYEDVVGYVPSLPEVESRHYGRYLSTSVAGCRNCHSAGGSRGTAAPFAGGAPASDKSFFGSLTRLALLFVPDKDDNIQDAAPYMSDEAKTSLGLSTDASGAAGSSDAKNLALEEGRFPIGGPDIRGKSGTIVGPWSIEQIVEYLSSGRTPTGESADGRFCPWPFYSSMQEREKRAIALYLKSL